MIIFESNNTKKTSSLLLISFGMFIASCGNPAPETTYEASNITASEEQHDHSEEESLQLNQGEKWEVDAPMMVHIRNMENEIQSFTEADTKDHTSLASSLEAHIDLLTSNCTMTGQAHEELHKWLVPHIAMVNDLSATENAQESRAELENIRASFSTFNQYFQ